ncbi:endoribonuclease Dicer-like protein 3a [Iris pallida]|uniref:Endoribonuclease Dicer-like protein 3a n=1 Tax=Iris pallida TaxID=29817 RepID=A0AAX6E1Q7_IRIPA|nr:endoribonuclease Dicer-like protein 3a [Iris pallida]
MALFHFFGDFFLINNLPRAYFPYTVSYPYIWIVYTAKSDIFNRIILPFPRVEKHATFLFLLCNPSIYILSRISGHAIMAALYVSEMTILSQDANMLETRRCWCLFYVHNRINLPCSCQETKFFIVIRTTFEAYT